MTAKMELNESWLQYATETQVRYFRAIAETGSQERAAAHLGVNQATISRSMKSLRAKWDRQQAIEPLGRAGFDVRSISSQYDENDNLERQWITEGPASPFEGGGEDAGPARDGGPGYLIKGVSTLFGPDGEQRAQWVKTAVDQQLLADRLQAVVDAMCQAIVPVAPVAPPALTLSKLMVLYTFTDYHVGMLAWHRETGADWDLKTADRLGTAAMQALVDQSPAGDTAVVSIQGDFIHWDGLLPVTPTHGHVLDGDSRFDRVVDVAIDLILKLVDLALQKHRNVHLLIAEGNHDMASSLWLRKLFVRLYANDPRVTVDDSPLPYYAVEWGQTMLGVHHGHLKKNAELPALFSAQFRAMWGRCSKVYIHTGHRHHAHSFQDHPGARVIQHPTLAARDAYAARGGWWSEREISAITYHKDFGQVGTVTVTPEMLE